MEPFPFFEEPLFEPERFATVPDFFVDEVRLDAAAARCVVLPELFLAALFPEERAEVFEPPRADERAAEVDFFEADERDADLPDFFAAVFFAVVFFAVVFLAAVFLAAVFEPLFAADFFAVVFFAAVFFAPDRADDFAPPFFPPDELRALFFAGVDVEPLAPPALLILMSFGFDLSSVGMNASFKGLRVHRHACKRQRRYIKRVPINGKCRK